MIKWLFKLGLSSVFLFSSFSETLAVPVLEDIEETGLLKVAIREDAVPFGYRDSQGELSGLCLDLIQIVREEIKATLNKRIISIRLYKSSLFNRFSLVSAETVHFECGPNTIRKLGEEYNVQFSNPFFLTGTQLLIKSENQSNINLNGSLEKITIGVLQGSTNKRLIEERYPQATLKEFLGVTGRLRGIQAVQQGRIDAFASDGILLIGEAVLLGLGLGKDYLLIPSVPLECDYYGLILPQNDLSWTNLINNSIEEARQKGIFREWFGIVVPEIQETLQSCQE